MASSLHGMLEANAAAFPDRPWLHFQGDRWTYGEGNALADAMAVGLSRIGVKAGDRVALLFTNCPEIVFCYFACFKLGAIAVPINSRLQAPEVVYTLGQTQAVVLIGQADLCAAILRLRNELPHLAHVYVANGPLEGAEALSDLYAEAAAAAPAWPCGGGDVVAALLYTSGTTAKPKGVIHTHATLLQQNANLIDAYGSAYAITAIVSPICHIGGFSLQMLVATEVGGEVWIMPRFDPQEVLQTLVASGATFFFGLPAHINMMASVPGADGYDLSALQRCISGGDCVPLEVQSRFKAVFGVDVDEGCGLTEAMITAQPGGGVRRPGSIGKPIGDVRIRLEDAEGREVPTGTVGEIVIFSGAVTPGYWSDPEATATAIRNGGFHSGDLASRDEDGFYWFKGRSKDIIIRGGSNISPGEVEDVLYAHPAVYEAGVVGAPDEDLGAKVLAYVALKPDARASEAELLAWCAGRLAAYKLPESIVFAERLPLGPTGKVFRRALRARSEEAEG